LTELETLLRARYPLLYLHTPEEERAVAELRLLAQRLSREVHLWSATTGFTGEPSLRDPILALDYVREATGRGVYVFCDFHAFLGNALVVRKLRELGHAVKHSAKAVILLSPVVNLPPEVSAEITLVDFATPDSGSVIEMLAQAGQLAGRPLKLDPLDHERFLAAARGLTAAEIANGLARALVLHGALDHRLIEVMTEEKRRVVSKTGVLEHIELAGSLDEIGGLAGLKEWLRKRGRAFGREARSFGLPEPRGLLLLGAPGCGKSLVAKSVSRQWGLPLLRLDVGRLMAGLVGASEENTRRALKVAESVSPVVLWVDEVEKALASAAGDGGSSARVLATFLTWLQEKRSPVFVVATANDLSRVPLELLRKGRFDEIFFVDLPDERERAEILALHLRQRHREFEKAAVMSLAAETKGFSGAELEQGIIDALYDAFDEGRAVEPADVARAFARLTPLARGNEALEASRTWARGYARWANGSTGVSTERREWAVEGPPGV
jgi:ATP-dependent 26S proteasome regulatory subunit